MKNRIELRNYAVWIMLVILVVFFCLLVNNFATANNLITILRQVATIGILSMGMTFVLLVGGIDLSMGAMVGLVGVASSLLMTKYGLPVFISCLLGIGVGGLFGFLNGVIIAKTKIPPLIMTLGISYVIRGFAYLINNGYPVYKLPASVKFLGQGFIYQFFPVCVLVMIIIIFIGAFILNNTHLGRNIYAVGGNEEAARLSGINVYKIRIIAYIISGLLSGLAGIVMMSRVNSGQALSGTGMEMDALIACVVGGISVTGGEGKATGMIGGMLVMGVLQNGMAIAGLNEYLQSVVKGAVLCAVVAIDCYSRLHVRKFKK